MPRPSPGSTLVQVAQDVSPRWPIPEERKSKMELPCGVPQHTPPPSTLPVCEEGQPERLFSWDDELASSDCRAHSCYSLVLLGTAGADAQCTHPAQSEDEAGRMTAWFSRRERAHFLMQACTFLVPPRWMCSNRVLLYKQGGVNLLGKLCAALVRKTL